MQKSMGQARLRFVLFALWVSSWALTSLTVLFAPALRSDQAIGYDQTLAAVLTITGLWIPGLTCFAVFWFPKEDRKRAARANVSREQAIGGIVLTSLYLLFLYVYVVSVTYVMPFDVDVRELQSGASFEEQIAQVLKYGLLLSFIGIAPTAWLTRVTPSTDRPAGASPADGAE